MPRYQRGWLRVVERKQGRMWQLRYNVYDCVTGKKKERARIIGALSDFPTESACWREIDRQGLAEEINTARSGEKIRFREIAKFYLNSDAFRKLASLNHAVLLSPHHQRLPCPSVGRPVCRRHQELNRRGVVAFT
jgi:hypothetical protein